MTSTTRDLVERIEFGLGIVEVDSCFGKNPRRPGRSVVTGIGFFEIDVELVDGDVFDGDEDWNDLAIGGPHDDCMVV